MTICGNYRHKKKFKRHVALYLHLLKIISRKALLLVIYLSTVQWFPIVIDLLQFWLFKNRKLFKHLFLSLIFLVCKYYPLLKGFIVKTNGRNQQSP